MPGLERVDVPGRDAHRSQRSVPTRPVVAGPRGRKAYFGRLDRDRFAEPAELELRRHLERQVRHAAARRP